MKIDKRIASLMSEQITWSADKIIRYLKILNIKKIEDAIACYKECVPGSKDQERAMRTWDRLSLNKLHQAVSENQVAAVLGTAREGSKGQDLALVRLYRMKLR